jgi:putative redox protein
MKDVVKHYTNGEVTVVWKSALCQHSGICVRGLPNVFDRLRRPWIVLADVDSETITNQVDRCPSGALSWFKNSTTTD